MCLKYHYPHYCIISSLDKIYTMQKFLNKSKTKKFLIFIFIVIIASFVRLWNLQRPDITPDELHYITDAQRLVNHDPYIAIRHHPFRHGSPSIGHPFLAQVIGATVFKTFGFSNFTGRLPYALAGISTVIILFFFNKTLGKEVAVFAAAILAIIPLSVRYSRDAHLDSIFALWITLVALFMWRYYQNKKSYLLVLTGLSAGLAISTKLDGVIALILATLLVIIHIDIFNKKFFLNSVRKIFYALLLIYFPALILSFLLNDPGAYIDGILNPSDPNYVILSKTFWSHAFVSVNFWARVLFNLLSPIVLILWIISLIVLVKEKGVTGKFLLVWQLLLLLLLSLHRPGVSGEYGALPLISAISVSVAYSLSKIVKRIRVILAVIFFALIFPFTFYYGFHIKPLPYYSSSYIFNRTISDDFYQKIINRVNQLAPNGGRVFLLPQHNYPLFSLRPDISWSYSESKNADVLVVDDVILVDKVKENIEFSETMTAYEDGSNITRFIFLKR